MISEKLVYMVDLAGSMLRQTIREPLVTGDQNAHTLRIIVNENGAGATLTGCTATAKIYTENASSVVTANGTITDNVIEIKLPSGAYTRGTVNIYVKLAYSTDSETRTIAWLTGFVVSGS